MPHKTLLAALMTLAAATGMSQSKISMDGLKYLHQYQQQTASGISPLSANAISPGITVIVTLAQGHTADELDAVQSLSFGGKKEPKMDGARILTGVDNAHNGISFDGTTLSFTGKGVIVGMFDTGFEANHLNFLNSDGTSRLERLWVYTGTSYQVKYTEYRPSTIKSFQCDDKNETHGTHVAGILTGSYKGNGTYAYTTYDQRTGAITTRTDQPIPYYGVAYGATPVFGVGKLTDPNIIDGVGKIVDYAAQQGKPCVVNLSLGSNVGPHDGTDDFTAALNELGKDAIIVISSGNEGDMDMSITKTLSDSETSISTFLAPKTQWATSIDSDIDIWASDSSPLTVTLLTYNKSTKKTTTVATTSKAGTTTFSTQTGLTSGSGTIYAGMNSDNKRYNVYISPDTPIRISSGYYLMIKVEGKAGQKINMYYSGYGNFSSNGVAGCTSGSAAESINSISTADNLIPVGSFVSRYMFGALDNNLLATWGENVGEISSFSSYGTLPDGTPLPYVLAPGSTIISSFNKYYVEGVGANYYEGKNDMTGKAANGSITDYWGAMDGTSMAAPFAAGVIALWLEADPSLDAKGIKDVLANSSTTDTYTRKNTAASGYGKINAEAGLKYILSNLSSVGSVTPDPESRLLITPAADGFDIVMGGESALTVTMFDLQGRPVARTSASGPEASLSTAGVAPGIYVIAVQGSSAAISRKVTVR